MLMNVSRLQKTGNQAGFASIIIAIILVVVLSLTTVGFARLMRNEERSALDKHLSVQAFKAAESGINDATKAINVGFTGRKTECGPWSQSHAPQTGSSYLDHSGVGSDSGIKYTCLLVDPTPLSLEYSGVDDAANSRVFQISGAAPGDPNQPANIKQLEISWQDDGGASNFASSGASSFPTVNNWPYTGILRIGITPLASGYIGRAALADNTYTALLYPNGSAAAHATEDNPNSAPTYSYGGGSGTGQGAVLNGRCHTGNTPRHCNVTISDLGQVNYLFDLRSLYRTSRVTISAWGYDGSQLRIRNAQTMIDSTGKAQDQLQRLNVRVPSKNTYVRSNYGFETSGNICKQLQLTPDTDSASYCTP